jgi:hypothetical protein
LGGCQTNAERGAGGDRAVMDARDFLVVDVDAGLEACTAVPLFPTSAVGNQPLVEDLKTGNPHNWIGTASYFSHWQHWRIPLTSIVAASGAEPSPPTERRRYATTERTALDDIRNWQKRNRAPYRPA